MPNTVPPVSKWYFQLVIHEAAVCQRQLENRLPVGLEVAIEPLRVRVAIEEHAWRLRGVAVRARRVGGTGHSHESRGIKELQLR